MPGFPLKAFDCFARVVQAAPVAVGSHGTFTVSETDTDSVGASASLVVLARSKMTSDDTVAVQALPAGSVTAPAVALYPLGTVTFSEPSVCELVALFDSVNVSVAEEAPAPTDIGASVVE